MTAITTYASFTAALAGLDVAGVSRQFDAPPASIAAADLPASWPGLPSGEEAAMTFDGGGGWPALVCDLIIAVSPTALNTQAGNYEDTITVMDGLLTALRAASIGRAKLSWRITTNVQVVVADTTYWAVIATVEGR